MIMEEASEEETFAASAAALLAPKRFAELDAVAADLRKQRTAFSSGASKLRAFYEALARHASLTVLGVEVHGQFLDDWHDTTGSAASRIARASFDYALSQRTRGGGYFNSVLPEDAEQHRSLLSSILSALHEVELQGECDAPCFDLQIRAGTKGGWSEPLQKLLKSDPGYWEAFGPAAFYLAPWWGGSEEQVEQFVDAAARATKESLGDTVYALHYWSTDPRVVYADHDRRPTPPDWRRVRKGFQDFLRLHPRSRFAMERFAFAAYTFARDRETARTLFQSPLLNATPSIEVWPRREEFTRARDWAAATVLPLAKHVLAGRLGGKRVTVPAVVQAPDGTERAVHPFVVSTPSGPIGVTTACDFGVEPCTVEFDGGTRVALQRSSHSTMATFVPPPKILNKVEPLPLRTLPIAGGDHLFVIADRVTPLTPPYGQGGFSATVAPEIVRYMPAGAPVLDDTGAVAAVIEIPGSSPRTINGVDILNVLTKR